MNRRTLLKGLAAVAPGLAAAVGYRAAKPKEFEVPEGWELVDLEGPEADAAYDSWANPTFLVSSEPLDDEALEVLRKAESENCGMLYGADGPPTLELPSRVEVIPPSIRPLLVEWEPPRPSTTFETKEGLVAGVDWARVVRRFVFLRKVEPEIEFGDWADVILDDWGAHDSSRYLVVKDEDPILARIDALVDDFKAEPYREDLYFKAHSGLLGKLS